MTAVTLRDAVAADIPWMMRAEREPGARSYLAHSDEAEHLDHLRSDDRRPLIVEAGGVPAGFALLHTLTDKAGNVELARYVIDTPGKGIGGRALPAIARLVFEAYPAHRLWLGVVTHNARARSVYAAAGFVEEGTIREAWVSPDGRRESVVFMSILRREWEARAAGS